MSKNRNMGNAETFEVTSSTFQLVKTHERKLEQILNSILVSFLELVVVQIFFYMTFIQIPSKPKQ
jgi:hypothetical protein